MATENRPTVRYAELRDGTEVPVSVVQTTLLLLAPLYGEHPEAVAAALAVAWDETAPINDASRVILEDRLFIQDGVMHASVRNVIKNAFDMVNPVVEVREGVSDDD